MNLKIKFFQKQLFTKILLWIGALFFLSEFFLHFFGLAILEHDKIFIPTHDRYIAIFALTYATLLFLVSLDLKKYKTLFYLTMAGILLGMFNALYIAKTGGYTFFEVVTLDKDLAVIGQWAFIWFPLTWIVYYFKK